MLRLPIQIEELGDDMAIEELRKVEGKSNTIETTVAGSPVLPANYYCPRANFPKDSTKSKFYGVGF